MTSAISSTFGKVLGLDGLQGLRVRPALERDGIYLCAGSKEVVVGHDGIVRGGRSQVSGAR